MRFMVRHVQQTLADYVEQGLTDLGWVDEPRNFGVPALEFQDVEPDVDTTPAESYLVGVAIPDVGPNQAFELGGGLREVVYDLNVHVWTPRQAITMSVCQDISDLLTDQVIDLYDYTANPRTIVEGAQIEFETVVIDRPFVLRTVEFRRPWRVVTALANLYATFGPTPVSAGGGTSFPYTIPLVLE